MSDNHSTKNYFASGGDELVIGGKLTILPGAEVLGADGLSGKPAAALPYLEDSKATSAAALREDFNQLLAAIRAAGLMAETPAREPGES
jgi:hypothetical protein